MKRIDLTKEYSERINSANWASLVAEAQSEPYDDGDGNTIGAVFLGAVFSLMPSGKFYMPWCTNQTWRDVVKDQLFMELLEAKASEHGGWIQNGEGDPCGLFFAVHVESVEA